MRVLSILALLAASVSFSSAATINQTCTPDQNSAIANGSLLNGGSTSASCAGFAAPLGSLITHVTISIFGSFTATGDNATVDHQIVFSGSISPFGPYLFGGIFTGIDKVSAITGLPPTTIRTEDVSLASIAPFVVSVDTSTVGGRPLPTSAIYTVSAAYTYESQTPEPGTLALVGGILALAGIRKFRR